LRSFSVCPKVGIARFYLEVFDVALCISDVKDTSSILLGGLSARSVAQSSSLLIGLKCEWKIAIFSKMRRKDSRKIPRRKKLLKL
jgi:hypothetical protein